MRRQTVSYLRSRHFNQSQTGKALAASLAAQHQLPLAPAVGVTLGRVVLLVRGAGLAGAPSGEQARVARAIASSARAHLTGAIWFYRRLVNRAFVIVFEDETIELGCTVLRYTECVVRASHGATSAEG